MKSTCLEKIKTCLESYIKNYKLVSLLAMFVIANFIGSCSSTGTLLDHDRQKVRAIAYARAAEPFALMSALAYATNGVNAEMLLRRNALETQLGASGWHRDGTGRFFPTPNALNVGLSYDVWINEVSQPAIIVIAARGTEFKDLRDWQSNTWWLTRWFSDSNQYRVITLPTEAGRVFAAYEKEITNKTAVVITTGHSLGGGLAQCLRYAYPHQVSQCYAFDPSPVTAYYDDHGRSKSAGNQARDAYEESLPRLGFPAQLTLRIYERGEILAYFRAFMRGIYAVDDKIAEVRFDFSTGFKPVAQHSMMMMAEKISTNCSTVGLKLSSEQTNQLQQYQPWWKQPTNASR